MNAVYASRWLGLAAVLLLSACIDTKTPLADPQKAPADKELIGLWYSDKDTDKDTKGVEYVHVGVAGGKLPPGVMRIVSCVQNEDGTLGRPGEMLALAARVGEDRYLNVVATDDKNYDQFDKSGWKPDLVEGYWLVKFRMKGDSLLVWTIDPDAKRRLVESGKIKGTVKDNSAVFTDTAENLAKLLASPDAADLFDKESETLYHRMK